MASILPDKRTSFSWSCKMAQDKNRSSLALPRSVSKRRDLVLLAFAFIFLGWLTVHARAEGVRDGTPPALIEPLCLRK
jgi:hypothetical protein